MYLNETLVITLIITGLLSFVLTYLVRNFAIRKKIIDVPNARSSHNIPTPRGGGLAIVFTWILLLVFLYLKNDIENRLFFALLSVIPLALIGIIDDILNISPKWRFTVQVFSVGLGFYFLNGVESFNVGYFTIESSVIIIVIFFIGSIWFINLFNFLDGIDAYSSMQAIFMAVAMFLFTSNFILLILAVSVLGFLIWNWPKAKIFMGDVGSTSLGYTLIILGVYFNNTGEFNFIYWIILSSLFWFDATITLIRRFVNKEKLSDAHKKHAYQRIVQSGFSHQKTVLCALCINLFLLGLVILTNYFQKYILIFFLLAIILMFMVVKYIDKKFPFQKSHN